MLAPAGTSDVETPVGSEVETRRPGCGLFELAVQFGEARQHMEAVAEAPMAAAHPGGGGLVALALQVQQDRIASEEPPPGFENTDDTVFPRGLAALCVWQGSAAQRRHYREQELSRGYALSSTEICERMRLAKRIRPKEQCVTPGPDKMQTNAFPCL